MCSPESPVLQISEGFVKALIGLLTPAFTGLGFWPRWLSPVKFFSKLNQIFLDALIQLIYFLIIEINNFRGYLSNISAKTATLVESTCSYSVSVHAR